MTTTHPSANDSGLNLDHLEALARAATAGPWLHRRDPDNPIGAQHCVKLAGEQGAWVCDCIDNADRSTIGGIAGERNAGFIAAANPSAVLELIALARRAALANQPAPTVPALDDLMTYPSPHGTLVRLSDVKCRVAHQPAQEQADGGSRKDLLLALQAALDTCATKSGVPKMSHLETLNALNQAIDAATRTAPAAQQEPVAAPQQAAAPGATIDTPEFRELLTKVWNGWHPKFNKKDVAALIAHIDGRTATSAPGTPEAPADDDLLEKVARAIWNVRREEEDRCDMELEDMGDDHPVWDEAEAAVAAIQRAAQLDGGQEGSAS